MILRNIPNLSNNVKFQKFYSLKSSENLKKYTDTIHLPKTKFPMRLTAAKRKEIEKSINENQFASLYKYQLLNKSKPEFILHDGPPYANGNLHMGHAVNKILKDITIRQHVVSNRAVKYKMGWDCHGLPIELKAVTTETEVTPIRIREKSHQFALQTIEKQKLEFKSWGVMADWNNNANIYKTLNPEFIENQLKTFFKFYEKKLVFRDMKPVFWSPSSRTALAEAELEYDANYESPSIILRLKINNSSAGFNLELSDDLYALIWTTTPWTLPANQAICFNPLLEYSICSIERKENLYLIATSLIEEFKLLTNLNVDIKDRISGKNLFGLKYFHPINNFDELPFLPGDHVKDSKGTGLVHTAPAHGPDDFLIGLQNNIKLKNLVDNGGRYTENSPKFLYNKHVLDEGDELVMNFLKKDILYRGKIVHSYPIDWRTKKPVIIKASEQWFINTDILKSKAIEEIENIKFFPKVSAEQSKRSLIAQIMKRPYWCISRQRTWGVPIPVLYNKISKEIIINESIINQLCKILNKEKNINFWWTTDIQNLLNNEIIQSINCDINELEKGKDIFDIWFDSGLTWLSALDEDKIADLYLEGYDQFNGWFQSSLLTSIAYRGFAPYKSLFVHGFTVDDKGHKMSKSLGNIISPKNIIEKYGTDSLRWWVASHATQNSSITVSDTLLKSSAESVSKVRSILRFINGALGDYAYITEDSSLKSNLPYLDRFMLNEMHKFGLEIQHYYDSYEYNRVIAGLQYFITNQLSALYLHLIKDRLYCGTDLDRDQKKYVLQNCYELLCKMLYPIIPFTIEESWSYFSRRPFHENNIILKEGWKCDLAENLIKSALEIRKKIYKDIKDINTWTLECELFCNKDEIQLLQNLHPTLNQYVNNSELCEIMQLSSICLKSSENGNFGFHLKNVNNPLCPRCRRYSLIDNFNICKRCDSLISF